MNLIYELFAYFTAPIHQKTAKQITEIDERFISAAKPLSSLITGLTTITNTKLVDNSIKVNEWAFQGDYWIEFELFRDNQHVDYTFKKQFYTPEFEDHCRQTWEIPKYGFHKWWDNLTWIEQQVEIETFVEKRLIGSEMDEHYKQWLANTHV